MRVLAACVHRAPKQDMGVCVSCLAAPGRKLWVGLADGRLRVFGCVPSASTPGGAGAAPSLALEEEWLAHDAGVLALAPAGERVLSLAADGSVRGWCAALPGAAEAAARCAPHVPSPQG